MKEKIKKIIKIALCFVLIMMFSGVIIDLIFSDIELALSSFVWLIITAFFIERIQKGKIRKLGWILAGIFAFFVVVVSGIGITGFILRIIGFTT